MDQCGDATVSGGGVVDGARGFLSVVDKRLQDLVHHLTVYSSLRFRQGFDNALQYLAGASPSTLLFDLPSLATALGTLHDALTTTIRPSPKDADVSIYVRTVVDTHVLHLVEGRGQYLEILADAHAIDAPLDSPSFSAYAFKTFRNAVHTPGKEPISHMLFPGSGTLARFNEWRDTLTSSDSWLLEKCQRANHDRFEAILSSIREAGSVGVFALRLGDSVTAPVVGVLCVVVTNQRSFFTWHRLSMIERFCTIVSRSHHRSVLPVLNRVSEAALPRLLESHESLSKLLAEGRHGPLVTVTVPKGDKRRSSLAFVISVDLRGSTDLMARAARFPLYFGQFLLDLSRKLRTTIHNYDGIFDKFTGDGILAFFPDFYGGSRGDAGLRVLGAAARCHYEFGLIYDSVKPYLSSVPCLEHTGLGIGAWMVCSAIT